MLDNDQQVCDLGCDCVILVDISADSLSYASIQVYSELASCRVVVIHGSSSTSFHTGSLVTSLGRSSTRTWLVAVVFEVSNVILTVAAGVLSTCACH